MEACASRGGCPSDYVALSAALLSMILLLLKATLPYMIHKIPRSKGSSFWLVAIQVVASLNLLVSIVMALNFLKFRKRHWWRSCYLWAVWIEGPLGFGLLLSCRITQIFQLYYIFVKRRLPPIRSYIFLLLILLPWIAVAAYKCPCAGILLFLNFSTSCLTYELEEEGPEGIQDNESGIRHT